MLLSWSNWARKAAAKSIFVVEAGLATSMVLATGGFTTAELLRIWLKIDSI
jgi:hypothetical protein